MAANHIRAKRSEKILNSPHEKLRWKNLVSGPIALEKDSQVQRKRGGITEMALRQFEL